MCEFSNTIGWQVMHDFRPLPKSTGHNFHCEALNIRTHRGSRVGKTKATDGYSSIPFLGTVGRHLKTHL